MNRHQDIAEFEISLDAGYDFTFQQFVHLGYTQAHDIDYSSSPL